MNLNSMGPREAQRNDSLPMSQVACTAKHKKQQPQAVSDKATTPERMEKAGVQSAKPLYALWARAPWLLVLGQCAQEQGAKIEGTREASPRHSGKLKKSLEVDRGECCCL